MTSTEYVEDRYDRDECDPLRPLPLGGEVFHTTCGFGRLLATGQVRDAGVAINWIAWRTDDEQCRCSRLDEPCACPDSVDDEQGEAFIYFDTLPSDRAAARARSRCPGWPADASLTEVHCLDAEEDGSHITSVVYRHVA